MQVKEATELVENYELGSFILFGAEWFDLVIKNDGNCKA